MSFFSSIKNVVKPSRKKVLMKVCMMGPRAVGKTTVLTSLYRESNKSIADSKLVLSADIDTLSRLDQQNKKLNAIFAFHDMSIDKKERPIAGIDASSFESTFDFEFGMLGKTPRVSLQIKDFPGEYVLSEQQRVINYIVESTAIIIAVDTPHLMEMEGIFNEDKNKVRQITDIFKIALNRIETEKLIMFVPLKSEKYFNENRMPDVLKQIKSSYKELIEFLSSNYKIACSVVPIKSLGDVQFENFSYNKDGSVLLDVDKTPFNVLYGFYSTDGSIPQYRPRFCSQPLYALLSFISAQYGRNKNSGGILNWLMQKYFDIFDSDEPLFNEVRKMDKNRLINSDLGFEILSGNELFQIFK